MANTKSTNLHTFSTALGRDNLYDLLSQRRKGIESNATQFKSFDFSNVAMYADKTSSIKTTDADFRRFHQMTLYIDANTIHHGGDFSQYTIITSNLPESISYSLGSDWTTPLNFNNATTNLLMQMAGSTIDKSMASGISRATTMRMWNGTKPLSLNLTIPVIDDGASASGTNLVEALEILGSLALPSTTDSGFYRPPPSPLSLNIKYRDGFNKDENGNYSLGAIKTKSLSAGNNWGRVMLQLGGILLVDYCIIESVDVKYPNTKAMIKHTYTDENFGRTGHSYLTPLLAEVTLKISTIEALTGLTYSNMLWVKEQAGQGSGTFDISKGIVGYASAAVVEGGKTISNVVQGIKK